MKILKVGYHKIRGLQSEFNTEMEKFSHLFFKIGWMESRE